MGCLNAKQKVNTVRVISSKKNAFEVNFEEKEQLSSIDNNSVNDQYGAPDRNNS